MAHQNSENKKLDFSNLPRGAISLRGLPVSRNTRLPSIRSPRDLTLGAPTKRTFMPNIPVRREKKSQMRGKTKSGKAIKETSENYELYRQKANARNNKYKANMSEEKKEIMRTRARERYRKKKECGLIQPISEKSDKEKRRQRKMWRNASSKYRRNKILGTILSSTPIILMRGKTKSKKAIKEKPEKYELYRQKANARNNKYKANMSEEKKEIMRTRAREQYRKKKELGLIQPISEKSDKEKRRQRKMWRNASSKYRKNKILDTILSSTPIILISPNVQVKEEAMQLDAKVSPSVSDRGRGKGRANKTIIQTQGSIFSEGVTGEAARKEKRARESIRSDSSSSTTKGVTIKKEVEDRDVAGISTELDSLFRDDFIDDGGDDCVVLKPVIFPPLASVKKEAQCEEQEPAVNFDPDIAKEMDFDVNRVAKFIKKEKGTEAEEKKTVKSPEVVPNEMKNLLDSDSESSKLVLLKFPQFPNIAQKADEAECSQRQSTNLGNKTQENQNMNLSSVKNLPEGHIGKLQILKSGKTRLLIGPVEYTLDSSSSMRNSKHELVSIATNSNAGDLCVLGCVNDVLNFVPNEAHLLGQC